MTPAYDDVRHCIHCGKGDFKNFKEVINHVKETHTR